MEPAFPKGKLGLRGHLSPKGLQELASSLKKLRPRSTGDLISKMLDAVRRRGISLGYQRFIRYLAKVPSDVQSWTALELRISSMCRRTLLKHLGTHPRYLRPYKAVRIALALGHCSFVLLLALYQHVNPCRFHRKIRTRFRTLREFYLLSCLKEGYRLPILAPKSFEVKYRLRPEYWRYGDEFISRSYHRIRHKARSKRTTSQLIESWGMPSEDMNLIYDTTSVLITGKRVVYCH